MNAWLRRILWQGSPLLLVFVPVLTTLADEAQVKRGEYLARAALCITCHTDQKNKGEPLAGGSAMSTPFGVIYSTNITPDPDTGIGKWTDEDFSRALRHGIGRDGQHLFPAFPYTTYARMTDEDIAALKAYLFSVNPVRKEDKPPEIRPPFSWRLLLAGWKWWYHDPKVFQPDPSKSDSWNRGAYLVNAVVHCGECHTPRDRAGGLVKDMFLAGTVDGPEGEIAPNITPHAETGIGEWSAEGIVTLLREGIKPDGDDVQGLMYEAIEQGYQQMSQADLDAIAEYLLSIEPIENQVE